MEERIVTCTRKTKETDISLTLNLDGSGKTDIHTCLLYTSDAADD